MYLDTEKILWSSAVTCIAHGHMPSIKFYLGTSYRKNTIFELKFSFDEYPTIMCNKLPSLLKMHFLFLLQMCLAHILATGSWYPIIFCFITEFLFTMHTLKSGPSPPLSLIIFNISSSWNFSLRSYFQLLFILTVLLWSFFDFNILLEVWTPKLDRGFLEWSH